jgi:hypothetical protein
LRPPLPSTICRAPRELAFLDLGSKRLETSEAVPASVVLEGAERRPLRRPFPRFQHRDHGGLAMAIFGHPMWAATIRRRTTSTSKRGSVPSPNRFALRGLPIPTGSARVFDPSFLVTLSSEFGARFGHSRTDLSADRHPVVSNVNPEFRAVGPANGPSVITYANLRLLRD